VDRPIPTVIADAATAVEIFSSGLQMYLPASAYCLVRGLLEHDQPDEAEEVLARVERQAPRAGIFAAWQREGRGRLAAHRGDHERALNEFLACGELVDGILLTNPTMFQWRSEAGLVALRLGQHDRARELIDDELARAERFGAPRGIGAPSKVLIGDKGRRTWARSRTCRKSAASSSLSRSRPSTRRDRC
jgi:hypothetical protein